MTNIQLTLITDMLDKHHIPPAPAGTSEYLAVNSRVAQALGELKALRQITQDLQAESDRRLGLIVGEAT